MHVGTHAYDAANGDRAGVDAIMSRPKGSPVLLQPPVRRGRVTRALAPTWSVKATALDEPRLQKTQRRCEQAPHRRPGRAALAQRGGTDEGRRAASASPVRALLPSVRLLRPATSSGAYAISQPAEIRRTAAVAEVRRFFLGFVTRPLGRPSG